MKGILMKTILLSAFVLPGCLSGKAQIVIGSDLDPVKGALLELKNYVTAADSTNTSDGGLVLPRVKLVNKATLEPFIQTTDAAWTNDRNKTGVDHIGLMVYNLTDNKNDFQQGIYVWTVDGWRQLEIASDYVYVPSFNLPWKDGQFDVYEVYKNNFKPTDFSHYVSSKGSGAAALVNFPDFESSPDAFYYVVTDYSESSLKIKDITSSGLLKYERKNPADLVPPEDAYLNIIMIRK